MGLHRNLSRLRTSDRAGTFSGVTGGRALSFHDLSVGEAPAPSEGEGNGGGGKFPSQISHRKDQPGRLGTKEKVSALSERGGSCAVSMQARGNVLDVTRILGVAHLDPNRKLEW